MNPSRAPAATFALSVTSVEAALAFYGRAFNAQELYRLDQPGGGVAHAECVMDQTSFFISNKAAEWPALVLVSGMTTAPLFEFTTTDCDAVFARAVAAGAVAMVTPRTQVWGMRHAVVRDPFGYYWTLTQAAMPHCLLARKLDQDIACESAEMRV